MSPQKGTWNLGSMMAISDSDAQILYFVGSLLLTAVLVAVTICYAISTASMVSEMRRQSRPYVFIGSELNLREAVPFNLFLRNTGNRVAQNIMVHMEQDGHIWHFTIPPDASRIDQERVRLSTLPLIRNGVTHLAPNESRSLGFVPRAHVGVAEVQRPAYRIEYQDGAGTRYVEQFSLEYRA